MGVEHQISARSSIFGEVNYVDLGTLKFGKTLVLNDIEGKGHFPTIKMGMNFRF